MVTGPPDVEEVRAGAVQVGTLLRFRGRTRRAAESTLLGDEVMLRLAHEATCSQVLARLPLSQVMLQVVL